MARAKRDSRGVTELFDPTAFATLSYGRTSCMFCFTPYANAKTFQSRASRGITVFCPQCMTRVFFYSPDSAIVAEAYRRILEDPVRADALKATLLVLVAEIKAEKGIS